MAAHARRSAYLTVVDAITQRNHLSRGSFGHGKTHGCSRTCVRLRALRWLGGDGDHLARRSRRTRAWSERRGTSCGTALIHNSVHSSANIVGNIERTVRPHRDAGGTMGGAVRSLYRPGKTIGEDLAIGGCMVTGECLKNYVVTALRVRRTIP